MLRQGSPKLRISTLIYPAMLGFACALAGTSVLAETTVCDGGGAAGSGAGKITAVPVTISAPGVYCVTQKISSNLANGAAITINANNVLLDLNDFAIGNLAAGSSTTAFGIFAVDRQNIHIRNGVLRGFWAGIGLLNGTQVGGTTALSSGHIVEGIVTDTSYIGGIIVQGPSATVKNNRVLNTIGTNVPNAMVPAQDNSSAIIVGGGAGIHVSGNEIVNTDCTNGCDANSNVNGIDVNPSSGPVIENNILINQALTTVATNNGSHAIHFGSSGNTGATTNAFVVRNLMTNWTDGITFCSGTFVCTGDMVSNGAQGVASPYSNGGTNVPSGGANY